MNTSAPVEILVWNKYCWINSNDPDFLLKIYTLLAYEVPNSRFTQSGEPMRSFLSKKNAFKTGFLPFVCSLISELGFEIILQDKRENVFTIEPEEIFTTLPAGDLRERQVSTMYDCVKPNFKMLPWYRGIINAATNFGKNWIICALVKTVMNKSKVVITVHRRELFTQLYDFLTENHIPVHRYGNYKNKTYKELGHITLVMPTSIIKESDNSDVKNHLKSVGTLIVDECHKGTAKEYSKILGDIQAYAVWYLSGTPFTGLALHDLSLVGDSGEVISKISNTELISDGVSQKPVVHFHNISGSDCALNYEDEQQSIITCPIRLAVMERAIMANINDVFLISVATKEHGNYLYQKLVMLPTTVDFLYSGDAMRTEKLAAFKEGRIKVLICTEILKEGVNLPLIRTLINAAWGKSVVWVKQFAGRLLRHDGINDTCTIIDFLDKGHHTRQHSFERYNFYQKESFEIINH